MQEVCLCEICNARISYTGALDFPDELDFTACPVKCLTTKSFNVRNVGRKMAEFSIKATPPFQVEPLRGKLDVGCAMQVSVSFAPKVLYASVYLHYVRRLVIIEEK